MKKIIPILPLIFLFAFGIAGCSSDEPVAIVNDEEILESVYNETLDRMKRLYEAQIDFESEQGQTFLTQLEENVLDMLIQQRVIFQAAKAEGYLVPMSQIELEFNAIRDSFESEADFEAALEDNVLTAQRFKESLQQDATIEAYFEAVLHVEPVTEEDVIAFYEEQFDLAEEAGQEIPELDEVFTLIENELFERRQQEAASVLVEQLMAAATIERLR